MGESGKKCMTVYVLKKFVGELKVCVFLCKKFASLCICVKSVCMFVCEIECI